MSAILEAVCGNLNKSDTCIPETLGFLTMFVHQQTILKSNYTMYQVFILNWQWFVRQFLSKVS